MDDSEIAFVAGLLPGFAQNVIGYELKTAEQMNLPVGFNDDLKTQGTKL